MTLEATKEVVRGLIDVMANAAKQELVWKVALPAVLVDKGLLQPREIEEKMEQVWAALAVEEVTDPQLRAALEDYVGGLQEMKRLLDT